MDESTATEVSSPSQLNETTEQTQTQTPDSSASTSQSAAQESGGKV